MAATIREIAEKTGVSITTISQILNGKGERFSDLTREKVLKTAKEMSYKPNFFAKNMIVSHTNTIGMIVPEVTDPFFSQMVKGAEDYLNREGYMIMLCNSSNDKAREDLYVEELLHRAVDGLIIASPNILLSGVINRMEEKRAPYILLDRQRNPRPEGNITIDDFKGGFMATEHLIKLGHRKIGIIISDTSFYNVHERYEGYLACMKEYKLTVQDSWIVSGDQTMNAGYLATQKLLKENVTAIFATNDLMAMGTYRAALEKGLVVPDNLSVIGFDDIELSEYMTPPLTTIRQPIYRIGEVAAELLLKNIQNPTEKLEDRLLDISLINRSSTKSIDNQ